MAKKKADKHTKELLDSQEASGRDPTTLTPNWQGRVCVVDPEKSFVAKQMGFEKKGEYAIKVR